MDKSTFEQAKQELASRLRTIVNKVGSEKDKLSFYAYDEEHPEDNYLVAEFTGGLNGMGHWADYLEAVRNLILEIGKENHCWLVKLDNDCPDDVFYLWIGIEL